MDTGLIVAMAALGAAGALGAAFLLRRRARPGRSAAPEQPAPPEPQPARPATRRARGERPASAEEMAAMQRVTLECEMKPVWFSAAAATHVGRVRGDNQDRHLLLAREGHRLVMAAVADGMGGHRGGETAAQLAVDELRKLFDEGLGEEWEDRHEAIAQLFRRAHREIRARAEEDPKLHGMGTTAVVALVSFSRRGLYLYAGDSALMVFRHGEAIHRTREHTLVQALVDSRQLKPEEARVHPMRSQLTSSLGGGISEEKLEIDPPWKAGEEYRDQPSLLSLGPGDVLLLCSDGLSGEVEEEALAQLVRDHGKDPSELVEECVRAALETGGKDNVTVVAIRLEEY